MTSNDFDAIVVGAGPNGLAAAITLRRAGLSVLLVEKKETIGGGMRSMELTLPGFIHDVCSAIHPMAIASPFFSELPLNQFGLEFIHPSIPAAHPFDDGTAAALYRSAKQTAEQFPVDKENYLKLIGPLLESWPRIAPSLLGPLQIPPHPIDLAKFGLSALLPATTLASRKFASPKLKALFTGMAAHAIQPLSNIATAAIGLVLSIVAHDKGWPIPKGGSQQIANALGAYFTSIGGVIQTGYDVSSLSQLPPAKAVLLDVTPRQLLQIGGDRLSAFYRWQLKRYKYGMGVFKVDWALDGAVPFTAQGCRNAGTVHLGNTMQEIVQAEDMTAHGQHTRKPFVLFAQPSVFDPSRAPAGKHTAWAYCHVPHGSSEDMTAAIEQQVERFAPGFRERILARYTMNTVQMEIYNPNYIGGDINGGEQNITQLFTRPALRFSPYRTSAKGIYLCSSSTPPGGGVHGMCGYHAARRALKDVFDWRGI